MKKKNNIGLIIILIIILLLLLFGIWFFLLKDKDNSKPTDNNKTEEKVKKDEVPTKENIEYDYREGFLQQIINEDGTPKVKDYNIKGVILIGNQHEYIDSDDTTTVLKYFESKGYNKEGINSSFYLNERIEIYVDTDYVGPTGNLSIFITPHHKISEYDEMSFKEILKLANEKGTVVEYQYRDEENPTFVDNPYISEDLDVGTYDILFLYKEDIAYFMTIDVVKQP
ncbi:MAG: hypothetical protein IKH54_01500 [Bacilli bacterium]|nr:hypothetical protein [Bacilli bacterium]